jgi:hypothetical protein
MLHHLVILITSGKSTAHGVSAYEEALNANEYKYPFLNFILQDDKM